MSINNFAAVTASKAGKEGTLKKIKKCLDSDALPDAVGDCDYCPGTVGKELRSIHRQRTVLAVNRKKAILGI